MNLEYLKLEIPYKWRIGQVYKARKKASCLAYIDARDVMDLLDFVVGADNWQDDYKMAGDNTMSGIGINVNGWVWKWDTGTSGNFEAEKSIISDSFKRAGVKWGIGRFLYDMEQEWVNVNVEGDKPYPVNEMNGERIWDLSKYINSKDKHEKRIAKARERLKAVKKEIKEELE